MISFVFAISIVCHLETMYFALFSYRLVNKWNGVKCARAHVCIDVFLFSFLFFCGVTIFIFKVTKKTRCIEQKCAKKGCETLLMCIVCTIALQKKQQVKYWAGDHRPNGTQAIPLAHNDKQQKSVAWLTFQHTYEARTSVWLSVSMHVLYLFFMLAIVNTYAHVTFIKSKKRDCQRGRKQLYLRWHYLISSGALKFNLRNIH